MADLGFGTAKANSYGANLDLTTEKIANLYVAPAGDKDDYSTDLQQQMRQQEHLNF